MMLVALLLMPWIMQMRSLAAIPRVLADDLQLLAPGPQHLKTFEYAYNKTHEHPFDMGARLAPTKSIVFSTDSKVSSWMKTYKWRWVGATLAVVQDCRD